MHDRSDSVVLDSRVWITGDDCDHLPYYNADQPGHYYRLSSDMALGLPRERISDWSDIVYCEFKIDRSTDTAQWNDLAHWFDSCREYSMPRHLSITLHDFEIDFGDIFVRLAELEPPEVCYIDLHDFTPRFPECDRPVDVEWFRLSLKPLRFRGGAVYQYK